MPGAHRDRVAEALSKVLKEFDPSALNMGELRIRPATETYLYTYHICFQVQILIKTCISDEVKDGKLDPGFKHYIELNLEVEQDDIPVVLLIAYQSFTVSKQYLLQTIATIPNAFSITKSKEQLL